MRITKVSVKKLFGIFDHEIPLNQESRITIIHGPNGFGKTTLLSMIHGLFNGNLWVFYDVPFEEFCAEIDTGERIFVVRDKSDPDSQDTRLKIIRDCDDESGGASYDLANRNGYLQHIRNVAASKSALQQVYNDLWLDFDTGAVSTTQELVDVYLEIQAELYATLTPDWFKHLCEKTHTRFAESQRLQGKIPAAPFRNQYHSIRQPIPVLPDTTVERLSRDLVKEIDTAFEYYSEVSRELDSSFLKRLVDTNPEAKYSRDDLKEDLERLEEERKEFVALGLLDKDNNALDSELDIYREDFKAVSIHVHDRKAKQQVLKDIAQRLRILVDIVNERFKFKMLRIDREKGFVFLSHHGLEIPLERLSSGEQHELVLFYRLLFHIQKDSLILVDEPEISLHVTWQRKFLMDLKDVVDMSHFDVLVATHSPQIVHDKYDWMVDLNNPEDELADDVLEYAAV
ncbi:MAG: AAA family ATPase [Chloroflexi bacterium]|nr:AAA family ATPase [Chloroflexota bacterium]